MVGKTGRMDGRAHILLPVVKEEKLGDLSKKTKIRVYVSTSLGSVSYTIEVRDPNNAEEIREELEKKDPAEWDCEPNFYESYGMDWKNIIGRMTDKEILDQIELVSE